jgi:hypothetical protein
MGQDLNSLGMQAAGGVIGGGAGLFMGGLQNQQQQNQNSALIQQQLEAQKNMAQFNQGLQMQMWDYTNYENQVKHMEAAGINPALLYGKGGGGSATTGSVNSNVSQQSSQSGGSGMAGLQMGLGLQLQQAQVKLVEAQAQKAQAEADAKRGWEKGNTEADTTNKQTQNALMQIDMTSKNLQNEILSANKENLIAITNQQLLKLEAEVDKTRADASVAQGTVQTRIDQQKADLIKTGLEQHLIKANTGVSEARIKEIANDMIINWNNGEVNKVGADIQQKRYLLELKNRDMTEQEKAIWNMGESFLSGIKIPHYNETNKTYNNTENTYGDKKIDIIKH